jgi:aspartate/methionine/tyrosine aminotransferase
MPATLRANPDVVDTGTPPIPEARAWLEAYDGGIGPAINLSQAAPGTPPPGAMLDRLAVAARDPSTTGYGPILGEPALIETYARHLSRLYCAALPPDEIVITAGCNQAFVMAALAVARAGDAVLLPRPWYFNHQMALRMLGIEVMPLDCSGEAGFVPSIDSARRALTPRTRALVLVTPNNPTGAIYPPATLRAFATFAREHGLWLILDETYRDFLAATDAPPHDLFSDPELSAHTFQLYSFAKSYAVPGHRVGALRAPRSLIPEIAKIADTLQICAPRVGQTALAWAIPALAEWREENRRTIVARAEAFRETLTRHAGLPWRIESLGAYFAYVRHPFGDRAATEIARRLAIDAGVLTLPGSYFGGRSQDRHLRFAFANADAATIATLPARLARIEQSP